MTNQEIIFSFESSADAARAGIDMNKADPSLRYIQVRATIIVTWHANIFVAAQTVTERSIKYTITTWDDVKNAHRR